jgi:hypothetical protein
MPPLLCRLIQSLAIVAFVLSTIRPATAETPAAPEIVGVRVGFGGIYKLGCWTPITVELRGGAQSMTGRLVVTVPDTDGVPTRVSSDPQRPVGIDPQQTTSVQMFVRVGQAQSAIDVQYVADDGEVRAERTFPVVAENPTGSVRGGVPATNRLLLEFGPALGLGELLTTEMATNEQVTARVTRIESAVDLPTRWYGYESVDTVLMTTSDPQQYRPLLQNRARVEALQQWIDRGGRLILFCAAGAEELLSTDGALQVFAPGRLDKMERLVQSQPLTTFSGSEQPITRDRRINLSVPSLVDVEGQILAAAGGTATSIPLVVRTPRGLGEVVFVGLDFDRPPLRNWAGRTSFLRRVFDWQDPDKNQQSAQVQEVEDLTSHLRNALDQQFVGVEVVPFGLVAALAGLYILLLGPGDYFFVKRILRRTELTWLTFPLIVAGVSVAAYTIANHRKGDQLRLNQVEIIDVDCMPGGNADSRAHGTVWTHFFTPRVSDLNLSLQPGYLGRAQLEDFTSVVSWLGLPGYSLGGMQASGSQTTVFDDGYDHGNHLATLEHLPVQVWSTKTLTARWSASVRASVEAELQQNNEELLQGQLRNNSGVELQDCVLLYGRWAYQLGRMTVGKSLEIDDGLQPRTVKTLLTNATAGDETITKTAEDGTVPFHAAQWDVARLVKAMMFYEAINGMRYTGKYNRYQSFVDSSSLLAHKTQAVLLARCQAPGSQWLTDEQPLAGDQDRHWTYYRFVFPVELREPNGQRD